MLMLAGKPILEHQIDVLKRNGITDITILVGYLGDVIQDYFGNGDNVGVKISYFEEKSPLGTSGCLRQLDGLLSEDFILLYGDLMLDIDVNEFAAFHHKKKSSATLAIHPNDHPFDSDIVIMDENCRITDFIFKDGKPEFYSNLVNAALYILSPSIFKYIPEGKSDFVKNIFPVMLKRDEKIYGYKTAEYIKDIGTIERLKEVEKDFISGRTSRFAKNNKRPAVFLDRDGTLIRDIDFLHKMEDMEIFPFSAKAIKYINNSDYLCFLITNQPVVARNLCDISNLRRIHNKLETILGQNGAYLNDIYFCPHHPDKGYPGESAAFKIACDCRKPGTGMISRAVEEYSVDIESSWFIGDTTSDIQTGINAGLKTILVRTGKGGRDNKYNVDPDFVLDNVRDAVGFVLNGSRKYKDTSHEILNRLEERGKAPFIITVGGLARSGKSTFVSFLKDYLAKRKVSSAVISLDNWIVDLSHRNDDMTVRERYKYAEMEKDFLTLFNGGEVLMNVYDPYSRAVANSEMYRFDKNGCVIVVGVPALDVGVLREESDIKIYIEVDEATRRERFTSFYKWKDISDDKIEELYNKRLKDEVSAIEGSKRYADLVLRT